jgi:predicted SprT family Zn-dependent metalloprotease
MPELPADMFRSLLRGWGDLWGVPDLADSVAVRPSTRLRRSLGRCRAESGRISIHAGLLEGDRRLFEEVLCHEAAHVAAHRLAGRSEAPHGELWRDLVRAAGFEPRVRAKLTLPGQEPPANERPARPTRFSYEHRCPICQSVRYARTAHRQWLCADCVAAGLPGTLEITRISQSLENS